MPCNFDPLLVLRSFVSVKKKVRTNPRLVMGTAARSSFLRFEIRIDFMGYHEPHLFAQRICCRLGKDEMGKSKIQLFLHLRTKKQQR
jgi:hypothetical protein